nr:MAG: internal scaffolding protein [Microvirus sp.]
MEFFSRYHPAPSLSVEFEEETLTQQHFKDECDINNIVRRYEKTGFLVDPLTPGTVQPMYDDFTAQQDFLEAQTLIAHASQAFDELPASLRKRFSNNPAEMLAFLEDESNREEAVKLGLVSQSNNSAGVVSAPAVVLPVSRSQTETKE